MNIVVCDDDESIFVKVKQMCEQVFSEDFSFFQFTSALELLEQAERMEEEPDLFILDIELPVMSGIELRTVLEHRYFKSSIIFLTNHEEMMQEAFGRCVIGFVDKQCIEKQLSDKLWQYRREREDNTEICLGLNGMTLKKRDIVCVLSAHVYSRMLLAAGVKEDGSVLTEEQVFRRSMQNWQELLDETDFYRIHKSCIIHFAYVEVFGRTVKMRDGAEYKVSRGAWKGCSQAYRAYCRKRARCI